MKKTLLTLAVLAASCAALAQNTADAYQTLGSKEVWVVRDDLSLNPNPQVWPQQRDANPQVGRPIQLDPNPQVWTGTRNLSLDGSRAGYARSIDATRTYSQEGYIYPTAVFVPVTREYLTNPADARSRTPERVYLTTPVDPNTYAVPQYGSTARNTGESPYAGYRSYGAVAGPEGANVTNIGTPREEPYFEILSASRYGASMQMTVRTSLPQMKLGDHTHRFPYPGTFVLEIPVQPQKTAKR
jgi:hypothetical protein